MKKIKTSALIGLGALGILFGRKMPGVHVIADEDRLPATLPGQSSATAKRAASVTSPLPRANR